MDETHWFYAENLDVPMANETFYHTFAVNEEGFFTNVLNKYNLEKKKTISIGVENNNDSNDKWCFWSWENYYI